MLTRRNFSKAFMSQLGTVRGGGGGGISHSFVSWFDSKIPNIKESMLANVRKAVGLGSPPATFYSHSSE